MVHCHNRCYFCWSFRGNCFELSTLHLINTCVVTIKTKFCSSDTQTYTLHGVPKEQGEPHAPVLADPLQQQAEVKTASLFSGRAGDVSWCAAGVGQGNNDLWKIHSVWFFSVFPPLPPPLHRPAFLFAHAEERHHHHDQHHQRRRFCRRQC